MALDSSKENLQSRSIQAGASNICYLDVGEGRNVLLLPGWSLSPRIYQASAVRLAAMGFRVVVPEVYGLDSQVELSRALDGVVDHVSDFASAVFEGDSFSVIGHSLGGAISILLVASGHHDVEKLVLVNSIGDPTWQDKNGTSSTMSKRPLNDWVGAFMLDFARTRNKNKFALRLAYGSLMEFTRNPGKVVRYALIAKSADVRAEMKAIADSQLRVLVIWTKNDFVIPRESFEGLANLLHASRVELDGSHGWIFTSSEQFASLVGQFLKV